MPPTKWVTKRPYGGKALPSEEVASHIGTIAYELVTKLTSRVAMEYVKS